MEASDVLLAAKPCWWNFDSSGYTDNVTIPGAIVLTQGWNGDVFVAAEDNDVWTFIMPHEGGVVWQDNICIPATSTGIHKRTAEHFINWLLDAEPAAMNTNFVWYASPNEAAKAYGDPEILEDPAVYLDEDTMAGLERMEPLPTEVWRTMIGSGPR